MSSPHRQPASDIDNSDTMPQPETFGDALPASVPPVGQSNVPATQSAPKIHPKFYFDDGNIDFLVGDTLYRVHRYFFCRDSPYFVGLLSNHFGSTSTNYTCTKSVPVALDDVKPSEFDAFLSILYPTTFHEHGVTTVEGWTSVLRLSTKWSFSSIRTLATGALQRIASSVDKVVLGRTYDIGAWLRPNLVALCDREQPLTMDEGLRLGVRDVILITSVRESLRIRSPDTSKDQVVRMVDRHLKPKDAGSAPEPKAKSPKDVTSVSPKQSQAASQAFTNSTSTPAKEPSPSAPAFACSTAQDEPWKKQPQWGRALSGLRTSSQDPGRRSPFYSTLDSVQKTIADEVATARADKQPAEGRPPMPQGPSLPAQSTEAAVQKQKPVPGENHRKTDARSSGPCPSAASKDLRSAPSKTMDIPSQERTSTKGLIGWAAALVGPEQRNDGSSDSDDGDGGSINP